MGVAGVAVVISARQDAILMIFAGASYVIHLLFTAYPLEMTGKGHSGGARIKAGRIAASTGKVNRQAQIPARER